MGLIKKAFSLYAATWGVPVRPTTKKERGAKETKKLLEEQNARKERTATETMKLLEEQNALLRQIAEQQQRRGQ